MFSNSSVVNSDEKLFNGNMVWILDRLQNEVISGLLVTANTSAFTANLLSPFNRKRLANKKVLIIFDDVSELRT